MEKPTFWIRSLTVLVSSHSKRCQYGSILLICRDRNPDESERLPDFMTIVNFESKKHLRSIELRHFKSAEFPNLAFPIWWARISSLVTPFKGDVEKLTDRVLKHCVNATYYDIDEIGGSAPGVSL